MKRSATRARRAFTPEFKADAVRLVKSGRSASQVAKELDLTERAWGGGATPLRQGDAEIRVLLVSEVAFPVAAMCRVLEVSTSGFYDWRHSPSRHEGGRERGREKRKSDSRDHGLEA